MRRFLGLSAAAVAGSSLLLLSGTSASAQVANANWDLPNSNSTPANNDTGTSQTAQAGGTNTPGAAGGWYMSPAANPDFGYTNPGQRDQFYSVEPIVNPGPPASGWSFWLQTFTQSGFASQTVSQTDNGVAVAPGTAYTFSSQMSFQDGSGPGMGYNATTLANQTEAGQVSPNTGDLNSYLEIVWENARGNNIGNSITNIPAGSVSIFNQTSGTQAGATAWAPYSVTGTAPAGAVQAELLIGWNNGGLDGNTGGQSAFADDATFATVPEPATLSLLGLGGMALLGRRRSRTA
jgi:hypothetical protein